jgi:4-hydroxy-tetrahydrodipicolinate synthase
VALVRAAQSGDAAAARRLNASLEPLWALFKEFSSLRVIYACADLLGICRAEPPRPILPLSGAARQRVVDTLKVLTLS